MASNMISDPVMNTNTNTNTNTNSDRARDLSRRRKKKYKRIQSTSSSRDQTHQKSPNSNNNNNNRNSSSSSTTQWKSESQQQVYSSKLLQALRHVHVRQSSSKPGRAVREAADRVLAVTARGKTRWSRAILTNRLKLKFMKNKRQRAVTSVTRSNKKPRLSILRLRTKNLPAVQRKARVLGRLVPGCRKEGLPVILEEATDYIAALEMQVRAMAALAHLLSGAGCTASPPVTQPASSSRPSTS